jgi:hypothetical protein
MTGMDEFFNSDSRSYNYYDNIFVLIYSLIFCNKEMKHQ